MSGDNKDVKLSLTVMLNQERNKLLYAVANSDFADILLSFLTLPLGRIVIVLEKHYGDEAPAIGSLNNLYHSIANLDSSHFVTEVAKQTLLNPKSSFEAEYKMLKVDISDPPPAAAAHFLLEKSCEADAPSDSVLTNHTSSFLISSDLHLLPSYTRFSTTIRILGITVTDMDNAETIKVDFGLSEASLTSPTPLSDLILNKTTAQMNNTPVVGSQQNEDKLYNEFLLNLLTIPLGGVEKLLAGNTCFKGIYNLCRSTTDLIDETHFKGSVEDRLRSLSSYKFDMFPKGERSHLRGPRSYMVKDDLSVEPYCFVTLISSFREQKILISDVEEVELKIGSKELLDILKATLTSTTVLSDALLSLLPKKQPKRN